MPNTGQDNSGVESAGHAARDRLTDGQDSNNRHVEQQRIDYETPITAKEEDSPTFLVNQTEETKNVTPNQHDDKFRTEDITHRYDADTEKAVNHTMSNNSEHLNTDENAQELEQSQFDADNYNYHQNYEQSNENTAYDNQYEQQPQYTEEQYENYEQYPQQYTDNNDPNAHYDGTDNVQYNYQTGDNYQEEANYENTDYQETAQNSQNQEYDQEVDNTVELDRKTQSPKDDVTKNS